MKWFRILLNEDNKIWRKYIIFREMFSCNNNEIEICKNIELKDYNTLNNLTIHALDHNGKIVNDQKLYEKQILPNFAMINNLLLIKDEVYKNIIFESTNEMKTFIVKLAGKFENNYQLMCFENIIDCVDSKKSIRKEFETFSKMVLDKRKIPKNINGFFLSGWDWYGQYENIVNESLKENLLKLNKASEFLIFEEIKFE